MNSNRAQSALEFVIVVMAMLFLFVGLLVFVQERIASSKYESLSVAVREVALTVREEISLAQLSTDGYSRQFTLPGNINGYDYKINVTEDSVYVRTDDGRHAIALPVGEVIGDVVIGINSVSKTNNTVFLNA